MAKQWQGGGGLPGNMEAPLPTRLERAGMMWKPPLPTRLERVGMMWNNIAMCINNNMHVLGQIDYWYSM